MDPLSLSLGVVVFALLGTAAGVMTGLIPGLHVNTVAALVLAFKLSLFTMAAGLFAWAAPTSADLAVFVAALVVGNVVAHTFLDYVPSIFLGAPEAETALSVLPGHRMLLQGRGVEAVRLSARGSAAAILLSFLLLFPIALLMGPPGTAYQDLRPFLPLFLLLVVVTLIVAEPGRLSGSAMELVCEVPDGILEGKPPSGIPERTPSQVSRDPRAFLLRGRVIAEEGTLATLADEEAQVDVSLRGHRDGPLPPRVALFVTAEPVSGRMAPLLTKGWAALVFLLAGTLGTLVLLTSLEGQNWYAWPGVQGDPNTAAFLPLFTGLFGLPTLLLSFSRTPHIPAQELRPAGTPLRGRAKIRAVASGSLAGAFVAWIPGVTAATATVLSQFFSGRQPREDRGDEEFILSVSCVNTATALFTIVALFVLLRPRSGGMVAVESIAAPLVTAWEPLTPMPHVLVLLLGAAGLAAAVAYPLTRRFGVLFARLANRIPYRSLVGGIMIFLAIVIFLFSGVLGLGVAAAATLVGLLPPLLGVRRVHLMGALLVPLMFVLA